MKNQNSLSWISLLVLSVVVIGCSGVQKKVPVKMIPTDVVDYLVRCERPFDEVRRNLLIQGYTFIKEGEGWLETDYKVSEKEAQRFLLGSISEERLRQHKVVQDGNGTKFSIHYKMISHSHPSDDEQIQEVSFGPARFTQAYLPILRDIHAEVCGVAAVEIQPAVVVPAVPAPVQPVQPAVVSPKPAGLKFLRERCGEGDAASCEFLQQQEAQAFIHKRCSDGDTAACDFLKQ